MIVIEKFRSSGHIHAVKVPVDGLKNGNVVSLGLLDATQEFKGEVYTCTAPVEITDDVVLLAQPFVNADPRMLEKDYVMKKDDVVRALVLHRGDQILVTKDLISGTPVVGQYVGLDAGKSVLKASATKIAGSLSFIVDEIAQNCPDLFDQDGVSIRVL